MFKTEDCPHPMMPDNNNDITFCVTKTWLILVADCCDNCPKCLWVCPTLSRVPSKDSHWLLSCYPALWLVPACAGAVLILFSCSDCYCWHCVAWPGLNYCSPVVCCCKTPQNWFATIKLYCKWVSRLSHGPDKHLQSGVRGLRSGGLSAFSLHMQLSSRGHRCHRGSILTTWHWHHHLRHSHLHSQQTDTGHTWGRSRKYRREFWK